jgi:uncharacterized protein
MDLSTLPLIDGHCHSLLRVQPQSVLEWQQLFTESSAPEIAARHVEHTVFYQWAHRALGGLYGCEPRADAILAERRRVDLAALVRRLNADANIRGWLVDYGFATAATFGHGELQALAGIRVERVLRLEPLIEALLLESPDFDTLHDAYVAALQNLRARGYISLKSIIAYRVGLTLGPATREDARAAFPPLRARAVAEGAVRLASKPFLDYFIPLAVEMAAAQQFPVQIHTGFGDPDQDLARGNPAFLRPLFEEKYRGARIVLLHASYPYIRTLGYLASAYPNVYADFGLALPFVAGDARAVLRELLGLAPASKVLYSSDAFFVPELHWLAARLSRRALGDVLQQFVQDDLITAAAAQDMARRMLYRNACALYALEDPSE